MKISDKGSQNNNNNYEPLQYHTNPINKISFHIKALVWKLKKKLGCKSTKTIPMWSRLAIELHSDCNRDCSFCPRYNDDTGIRKDKEGNHIKKSMPTWKVKDIIDQAAKLGYNNSIGFHRLSEALLDKRYIKIAKYAKEKGLIIKDHTNGDPLKNNKDLCKKLDGLLDGILIGLYDYKNEEEKKEQMEFWRKQFNKTNVGFSLAAEYPRTRPGNILFDKTKVLDKIRKRPCFATYLLLIRYDGEVSLCCQDDQCTFDLGNVFDKSIKDIWWSEKHIKIVNSLKERGNRNLYPLCRQCHDSGIRH